MIDPNKLFQLEGGQKRRKLALTFGALERDIAGIAEKGTEYNFSSMTRADYTKRLAEIVLQDAKLSDDVAVELRALLQREPFDERRVCNVARNALLAILGTFPAEWDLVIAPHAPRITEASAGADESARGGALANGGDSARADASASAEASARRGTFAGSTLQRDFYEGMMIYAEDIRSPFNLGSIFRSAEAMGAEKVLLSPLCTDPAQPRAIRSSMGCIETLGFERCALADLPADVPVFALETGGTPICEFDFPRKGICIIGSEELGISPEALARASCGTVSIPMKGLKASLNVGVALGILLQKWVEAIST